MPFDDAPAKGKSETRPLAHRFGREERLEDPPQDLGWNPRPRVAHRQRTRESAAVNRVRIMSRRGDVLACIA